MDARSLFAFLAVILLFWLIYTWIRWDSQERLARQSRQRLRDRLFDVTLSERVGKRDTVALLAAASAHSISRSDSADAGGTDETTDVETLRKQLEKAQAQAAAAQQNDLELRRLSSELESLQTERVDAAEQNRALEQRLREQQAALDAAEANALNNNGLPEQHESQTIGDSVQGAEAPSGKAPEKVFTPIFQAPSEKDDLKKIKGIGPVMERTLNALGVTTFQQLADFTQEDIDKVSEAIDTFPGRIERDDWVGKAGQILQKNKSTA